MPPNADDAPRDPSLTRHELFTPLTVIHAQAQLLQRRAHRMDGVAEADRERLEAGLVTILGSARTLGARIDRLPGIQEESAGQDPSL